MSPSNGNSNSNKIRRIVRIRQMLMRWRKKAAGRAAADVPAGHVAVCVGPSMRRFIVRATHLNHPIFQKLLLRAEEEYGFCNRGPLAIPCDEDIFEELLRVMSRPESVFAASLEEFQRRCHVDFRSNGTGSGKNGGGGGGGSFDFVGESWPLLHDELIY